MDKSIELLDCTLRDGAYIVNGNFGMPAIKGIINKMQEANADIIECGWLKNDVHKSGTTYYHVPDDVLAYISQKKDKITYVAMIDWDRYDLSFLPDYDGRSIDAIRVVFPHEKYREGIDVAKKIRKKGYKVFLQLANTLAYLDDELNEVAKVINSFDPVSVSIVDTFGAMYEEDLIRIAKALNKTMKSEIKLGFHSHNNQQLSFALSIKFIELMKEYRRDCVIDASLCGMGRGAGNATTELVANYLNRKQCGNYDMNAIMDAIDMYMSYFKENYSWGYSTPYCIAGMYCCHVNNISYLLKNHRTSAKDMRNIIDALSPEDRRKYDYDLLEEKYMENQNQLVDDKQAMKELNEAIRGRKVLLIAPGKTVDVYFDRINDFILDNNPIVIGVNAINIHYSFDYLFIINSVRYEYARETYTERFNNTRRIVLSNIKRDPDGDEIIINFNRVVKRGWEHFDNAVIFCLRMLNQLHVENVYIAGFDGFKTKYNESYADEMLPTLNPNNCWNELNAEIKDMYLDFKKSTENEMDVIFLTDSIFSF